MPVAAVVLVYVPWLGFERLGLLPKAYRPEVSAVLRPGTVFLVGGVFALFLLAGGDWVLLTPRPACPGCGYRPAPSGELARVVARLRRLSTWIFRYAALPGAVLVVFGAFSDAGRALPTALGFALLAAGILALLLRRLLPSGGAFRDERS